MLMYLREAAGDLKKGGIDRVIEREFHPLLLRKHTFHLAAERFVEAVVVVRVEESAGSEMTPKVLDLPIAEADVAMACKVEIWIAENFVIIESDSRLHRRNGN